MNLICWIAGHQWRYQRCTRCNAWRQLEPMLKSVLPKKPRAIHNIKIWPAYVPAAANGDKPFEIRRDDRDYQVGDHLVQRAFDPIEQNYGSMIVRQLITYVLRGEQAERFGCKPGYCILGLHVLSVAQDHSEPTT